MASVGDTNSETDKFQEEDVVDPWNVVGKLDTGVDYNKLISKHI